MKKAVIKKTFKLSDMKKFPSIHIGDENEYVSIAQENLKNRGYDIGKTGIDGIFGEKTKQAVKMFQKDIGMPIPNGSIGPKTWAALQESKVNRLGTSK